MGGGKGHKKQRQLGEQEYAETRKMRGEELGARRAEKASLLPRIEEFGREGYSEKEKADILGAQMEAGETAFDVGREQLQRHGARTRQSAGIPAAIAELARERGRYKGDVARGSTMEFASEAARRRQVSLGMLAQIYGIDTNLLQSMMGAPTAALGARAAGIRQKQPVSLGPFGVWG